MTRKTSKKAIVSVLFLFCALAVFAKGKAKPRQATLYEHGLSLAALMRKKAESSDYRAIVLGANGDLDEKVRELGAGDVSKPTAVYRLSGDFFFLVDMMGLGGGRKRKSFSCPQARHCRASDFGFCGDVDGKDDRRTLCCGGKRFAITVNICER